MVHINALLLFFCGFCCLKKRVTNSLLPYQVFFSGPCPWNGSSLSQGPRPLAVCLGGREEGEEQWSHHQVARPPLCLHFISNLPPSGTSLFSNGTPRRNPTKGSTCVYLNVSVCECVSWVWVSMSVPSVRVCVKKCPWKKANDKAGGANVCLKANLGKGSMDVLCTARVLVSGSLKWLPNKKLKNEYMLGWLDSTRSSWECQFSSLPLITSLILPI